MYLVTSHQLLSQVGKDRLTYLRIWGRRIFVKRKRNLREKDKRKREGQTGIETKMERQKNTVSAVGLGLNILPKRKLAIYLG